MELKNYKPKISKKNKYYADKIREYLKSNKSVGIIDVTGLPAPQFQEMRNKLRDKAKILIVKKTLISLVFKELEKEFPNISSLTEKVEGVCGLIFTNENPFKIYNFIKKNKTEAPAKTGQKAPKDIVVKAGPTSFAPGPIIGELGSLKIKAGIENGKVAIKEDTVVAKEGEVISAKLAEILTRLDIKPMEVGLNIKVMYEGGIIYNRDVLDIDENYYIDMLKASASESLLLSIGLNYYTNENIDYFIGKLYRDALYLAVGIDYISKETFDKLIRKAESQALGVSNYLPNDLKPKVESISSSTAESSESKNNEESKVSEEKKEEGSEDPAAGLGSLFG